MTIEQQKTFGEVVGMRPLVPVKPDPLPEDTDEVWYDCRGNAYDDESERDDENVAIVEDLLNERVKQCEEYATENDDYTSGYDHIIGEVHHEWADRINEWLDDNCNDYTGHSKYDDHREELVINMCAGLDGSWDGEWEYNHNEYAAYTGPGCCIWGFDIGECEEQVGVSDYEDFVELHNQGRLVDCLNKSNCDAYVSLSDYSLRGDYPCFEFYHCPGGRWDFVVSKDKMEELFTTAIIDLCRTNR